MITFDQYTTECLTAAHYQLKPTTIPAKLFESLKAAGLLPTTLQESSVAETAILLLSKITEMHRQIVADPNSGRNDKRLSYQNLNSSFLTVLAMTVTFGEE